VRLLQRAGPWGRPLLLLAATVLPALPWLGPAVGAAGDPRPVWYGLWLLPLYAWVCAGLALRRPSAAAPADARPAPVGVAALPSPTEAVAAAAAPRSEPAPRPTPAAVPPPDDPPAHGPAPEHPPSDGPPPDDSAAATRAAREPLPADAGRLEARLAAEQIGRRVITASGLLYGCTQVLEGARADLDTIGQDEPRLQALLVNLGNRLDAIDEHGQALARAALELAPDEARRAELARLVQAVQAQVLQSRRVAAAIDAVQRRREPRLPSLRQGLDLIDRRIERVLRDAQPLMKLTRRIAAVLGAAPAAAEVPADPATDPAADLAADPEADPAADAAGAVQAAVPVAPPPAAPADSSAA
jgi:hypothetical protein